MPWLAGAAREDARPTRARRGAAALWSWPCHKVPAAQAKSVAARQTLPGAGCSVIARRLVYPTESDGIRPLFFCAPIELMNIIRNTKIARLPEAIREPLNQRLDDGEPGNQLVAWLNEPAVWRWS